MTTTNIFDLHFRVLHAMASLPYPLSVNATVAVKPKRGRRGGQGVVSGQPGKSDSQAVPKVGITD